MEFINVKDQEVPIGANLIAIVQEESPYAITVNTYVNNQGEKVFDEAFIRCDGVKCKIINKGLPINKIIRWCYLDKHLVSNPPSNSRIAEMSLLRLNILEKYISFESPTPEQKSEAAMTLTKLSMELKVLMG